MEEPKYGWWFPPDVSVHGHEIDATCGRAGKYREFEWLGFFVAEGDALLDQRGCTYRPHVQGMRTGQSLTVKTSDPTAHNVHGFGKANRPFNRSQPAGAGDIAIRMRRDEASPPMKVKCDIHPWMNSYVAVVDHPYFAVTGDDGSFELPNLPPRNLHDRGLAREVRDDGADRHPRRQRNPGTRIYLRKLRGVQVERFGNSNEPSSPVTAK